MFLKLMGSENLFDDNTSKGCRIVANVAEVNFYRNGGTGDPCLDVTYSIANRGTLTETFVMDGNAYLMNDSGKTFQSFSHSIGESSPPLHK